MIQPWQLAAANMDSEQEPFRMTRRQCASRTLFRPVHRPLIGKPV